MAGRITRVALTNYRSIASCDVELQPLTFLVGPNGSGKSNFLDALRFLSDSMHAPWEDVVASRFGLRSLLRKLPEGGTSRTFSIKVDFELEDSTKGTYQILLRENTAQSAVFVEMERCEIGERYFHYSGGHVMGEFAAATPAFTGDRPALVTMGSQEEFAPVFHLLAGMKFYSPNPALMRQPSSGSRGTYLTREAGNIADVLQGLQASSPEVAERLQQYFTVFNPEFASVEVTQESSFRLLRFIPAFHASNWNLTGANVSDGTLRALALLLAVFQKGPTMRPMTLVGLEEPESNLHPRAAAILLDALSEASLTTQILATTHSADLLDNRDLPASAILAVALVEGKTIISALHEGEQSIIRERLFTPGELLRSNQLTPFLTLVGSEKT